MAKDYKSGSKSRSDDGPNAADGGMSVARDQARRGKGSMAARTGEGKGSGAMWSQWGKRNLVKDC